MRYDLCSVVAVSANDWGIGYKGKLLYNLPSDLKWFKHLTADHAIIMGKNTYESIGKLLPNRLNLVLSSTLKPIQSDNLIISSNYKHLAAIAKFHAKENDLDKSFVIGGSQVYNTYSELINHHYISIVNANKQADTFFEMDNNFNLSEIISWDLDPNDEAQYQILKYSRGIVE